MAGYICNPAGVNLTTTYASAGDAPFALGTCGDLNDGGKVILVESSASACSTYSAVVISETFKATQLTTGNARSSGNRIAFAQTSIGTGRVGWVHLSGQNLVVNLAANCAPYVPLYTTATGGTLDDATVSGSGGMVMGVFAVTSISNATATTCVINTLPFVAKLVGS